MFPLNKIGLCFFGNILREIRTITKSLEEQQKNSLFLGELEVLWKDYLPNLQLTTCHQPHNHTRVPQHL